MACGGSYTQLPGILDAFQVYVMAPAVETHSGPFSPLQHRSPLAEPRKPNILMFVRAYLSNPLWVLTPQ